MKVTNADLLGQTDSTYVRRVVAFGALIVASMPITSDLVVVSLPAISSEFGGQITAGHQVMSLFVLGLAAAHMFLGSLADRFGRRPVAIVAFIGYTLASLAGLFAPSLDLLLAARFAQGLTGAAGPILMRAIVRDTFQPAVAAKRMALIGAISGIAPLLAPTVGSVVAEAWGWRACFAVLTLYGVITALLIWRSMPETQASQDRGARLALMSPAVVRQLLGDGHFVFGSFAMAIGFGGLFTWVSTASYYLVVELGVAPFPASLIFAVGSLGFIVGGLIALWLPLRSETMLLAGAAVAMTGSGLAVLCSYLLPLGAAVGAPVILYYVGWGMIQPPAIALAMRRHALIAGQASALLGVLQLSGGVILSSIAVALGGGVASMAVMLAGSASVICASLLSSSKR